MPKEIGGYFGLESFDGTEYYSDLIALNNARNALLYLLKARKIIKLYIPYFLCDSVSGLLTREGFSFEYYNIDKNFLPVFKKALKENEYLYVVNYYGQITPEKLSEFKACYKNIILDNVQAFFQKPICEIDTIYSCRKFFGVPDGSYLYTTAKLDESIPVDVSKERMKHILGRFESSASEYYSDFKTNDHSFKEMELKYMSALTHNILRAVDYENVRLKRNENYYIYADNLDGLNKLSLKAPDGAYAYPLYCENGMEIKKKLAERKIYVATLWPNVLELDGTLEKDFAENILPLPCDQRYDSEDIKFVIGEIRKCIN